MPLNIGPSHRCLPKLNRKPRLLLIMLHFQMCNHIIQQTIRLRNLPLFQPVSIRFLPTALTLILHTLQPRRLLFLRALHIGRPGSNTASHQLLYARLFTNPLLPVRYMCRQILPHLGRTCTVSRRTLFLIQLMVITILGGNTQLQLPRNPHTPTFQPTLHNPHRSLVRSPRS